ncbi:signal peptidase I [Cellulomonas edaphi]|uniref:Signal peptidase I n=1 Tax=Cellulomonas edaphi TaxID=3053468 RepID=A0ABT7S9T9_9CELL|nr:signal peptidase I [Cellulomons edaphi]MDM7832314.1 signal peptidase I [Cellulomons edaphi]
MPRPDLHPVAATVERRQSRLAPPTPAPRRRRPLRRRLLSAALWAIVVVGAGAYATSLAVPLWYQVHDQRLLIVTSGSMAPYFDAGDAVVMQNVSNPAQLKPGLVVSFWPLSSDVLVTHRIVSLESIAGSQQVPGRPPPPKSPHIITKGDANEENDPDATPITRVRGIVLTVHPGWGWVLQWAGSPAGRATMLVPPLLALATLELVAVAEGRRRTGSTARAHDDSQGRHVDAVLHG